MSLKTDYKDDVLSVDMAGKRRYQMTENTDGTVSLEDESTYTQEGDMFGAADINATNVQVNKNTEALGGCKIQVVTALPGSPDAGTLYFVEEE